MVEGQPTFGAVHGPADASDPRRAARGAVAVGNLAYVDASALVKLPTNEWGFEALEEQLERADQVVSSDLLRVELTRACARVGDVALRRAETTLASVLLIGIDEAILRMAAQLEPAQLRSLDAIHLATALSLGDDLGVFVAYDRRLLDAARSAGMPTASPGA